MKRTSIGTWAYNIGPYEKDPIPFDTVGAKLAELGFDGMELGGFNGYPNPHLLPAPPVGAMKEVMAAPTIRCYRR